MTTVPGEQTTEPTGKLPSNLTQRILTAVLLLPIVLIATYVGGIPFALLAGCIACVGVAEFYLLAQNREVQGSTLVGVPVSAVVILAFLLQQHILWIAALVIGAIVTFVLETLRHPNNLRRSFLQVVMTLAGVFYVAFPAGFLVGLRGLPDGLVWIVLIYALTWGTDTFAYVGGRLWGKTKLAPQISPKKTREGAIVGIVGGIIPSLIILTATGKFSPTLLVMIVIGPFVAILGDLVESWLKRAFGVKDSHIVGFNILPGHGGVLDRIDALILVTTFCYFYLHLLVL
jgi:phosphatidate cytidylyltransferase